MANELDMIIARLQNVPDWNIHEVGPGGGSLAPWYQVASADVVNRLVVNEAKLHQQLAAVAAEVFHWARLAALARRVWEIRERELVIWRDLLAVDLLDPAEKGEKWKRPTEATVTATVHSMPEYAQFKREIERAEEAFNATQAVLEGFRAQLAVLKITVERAHDGSSPRMSV